MPIFCATHSILVLSHGPGADHSLRDEDGATALESVSNLARGSHADATQTLSELRRPLTDLHRSPSDLRRPPSTFSRTHVKDGSRDVKVGREDDIQTQDVGRDSIGVALSDVEAALRDPSLLIINAAKRANIFYRSGAYSLATDAYLKALDLARCGARIKQSMSS